MHSLLTFTNGLLVYRQNARVSTVSNGLSHITFIVRDLDKMEEMLTQVLDAKKV